MENEVKTHRVQNGQQVAVLRDPEAKSGGPWPWMPAGCPVTRGQDSKPVCPRTSRIPCAQIPHQHSGERGLNLVSLLISKEVAVGTHGLLSLQLLFSPVGSLFVNTHTHPFSAPPHDQCTVPLPTCPCDPCFVVLLSWAHESSAFIPWGGTKAFGSVNG